MLCDERKEIMKIVLLFLMLQAEKRTAIYFVNLTLKSFNLTLKLRDEKAFEIEIIFVRWRSARVIFSAMFEN